MRSEAAVRFGAFIRENFRTTVENSMRALSDKSDKMHSELPGNIKFPRPVSKRMCGQMEVYESACDGKSDITMIFLHGGAYCFPFSPSQWGFIADIASKTGCGFSTPNYPKLPNYTQKDSFPMVLEYYKEYEKNHDMSKVVIAGDSAGGSYVLTLMQKARDLGLPLPAKMILLSPWVDIDGGNPEMNQYDDLIENEGTVLLGKAWASGIDLKDPAVSPLYGDMTGLPKTGLWVGTWEVLHDQNMLFHEKLKAAGVDVTLHIGEEMVHEYPLYPIPEGEEARKQIADFILN